MAFSQHVAAMLMVVVVGALGFLCLSVWRQVGGPGSSLQSTADPLAPEDHQVCASNASDAKLARLCAWLEECKAEGLANVFVGGFQHGGAPVRGLGAARDLMSGERALCLPQRCWLRPEAISERLKQFTERCSGSASLAIHIAEERARGGDSFWAPYLDVLPDRTTFSSFHPAYMEENATLQDDINYWPRWMSGVQWCYAHYKAAAKETAVSPREIYLAYVQYVSRRYGENMVPLLDFPNTVPKAELTVKVESGGISADGKESTCLVATRDMSTGEELLVDYGAEGHSAMNMFAQYGFALAPHVHNASAHMMRKPSVDGCAGLRAPDFQEPDPQSHPVQHNLWRFARTHCGGAGEASPRVGLAPEDLIRMGFGTCIIGAGVLLMARSLLS